MASLIVTESSDISDTPNTDNDTEEYDEVFMSSPLLPPPPNDEDNSFVPQINVSHIDGATIPLTIPPITVTENFAEPENELNGCDFIEELSRSHHNDVRNGFVNPSFDLYNAKSLNQLSLPKLVENSNSGPSADCDETDDCIIPQCEKLALLRKFSAPVPNESAIGADTFVIQKQYQTTPIISDSHSIRAKLPDKYKCHVCHNPFNDPRVLDCLHTFCLECLFGIERNSRHGRHRASQSVNTATTECTETDLSGVCVCFVHHSSRQYLNIFGFVA